MSPIQIWQGRRPWLRLTMLLAVAGLIAVGLASIQISAQTETFDRQLLFIPVGAAAFILINLVHYRFLGRIGSFLYLLSLALLALLLIGKHLHWAPWIPETRGATCWLYPIPSLPWLRFQPSELAKLAYILSLAWFLSQTSSHRRWSGLIAAFLLTLPPVMMILYEPDLGTAILFPPVLLTMLFIAGARLRHLAVITLLALILAPAFYLTLRDYQKNRIRVLFNQNTQDTWWLRGPGYQLHQSKTYIGSGGWTGTEIPLTDYLRYRPLPDSHNDFIFALIGQRWGFIGAVFVLFLYGLLVFAGFEIASDQPDPFGRLLAVGVTAMLVTQTVLNIGMTMGLMPVTGITLPFVSYGGSSLVTSFIALGLLVNVARRRPYQFARHTLDFND
jgi:rod shape determining protein RodA